MKYICYILILFIFSCNPFPKKDAHPDVPYIMDLLKDASKFKKIIGPENLAEMVFLKDNRILLKPNESRLPFKIIDIDLGIVLEKTYNWKLPFYIDRTGDLYFNKQKYFYPDYKKHQDFETVVFQDSLDTKSANLGAKYADSLKFKMLDAYELKLLKPYGLKPCEYDIVHQERCDVFEIRNNHCCPVKPGLLFFS